MIARASTAARARAGRRPTRPRTSDRRAADVDDDAAADADADLAASDADPAATGADPGRRGNRIAGAQQLLDEHRVTGRPFEQPVHQRVARTFSSEGRDLVGDLRAIEPMHLDLIETPAVRDRQLGDQVGLVVPRRRDHHERDRTRAARQVIEDGDGRAVRPLDVIDDEQRRLPDEHVEDSLDEPRSAGRGRRVVADTGGIVSGRLSTDDASDCGRREIVRREGFDRRRERTHQWEVRIAPPVSTAEPASTRSPRPPRARPSARAARSYRSPLRRGGARRTRARMRRPPSPM